MLILYILNHFIKAQIVYYSIVVLNSNGSFLSFVVQNVTPISLFILINKIDLMGQ